MDNHKWTPQQARDWYDKQPWFTGSNFIPSTAINQLEMWQADTFDPGTIDRELGWAAGMGFNMMRVFLHDLLWADDAEGFKERINAYLAISRKHGIKTMLVLFDDCWHDTPKLGKQPEPLPGIHNSGWVKGPGTQMLKDETGWARLENYVKDIVASFGNDNRVAVWDIYNEPGNNFLASLNQHTLVRIGKLLGQLIKHRFFPSPTEKLLKSAFAWARSAQPIQPLTAGLFYLKPKFGAKLNPVSLALSDIVTFHTYFKLSETKEIISMLQQEDRPLVCTEYLARAGGNTFETHLPYFKENRIGAINWGLVSGKTQTKYSWSDFYPNGEEPLLWYHDILLPDGSFYKTEEGEFIRRIIKDK